MGLTALLRAFRFAAAGSDRPDRPPRSEAGAFVSPSSDIDGLLEKLRSRATTTEDAARIFDVVLRDIVRPHHQSMFWGDRLLTFDKSASFRDEPAFRAALLQADSSTGANQYESPDGIAWWYNTLIWAARNCLLLPGDYMECGVYRGDMTWMISSIVDLRSAGKKFYIYDTFSGLDRRYSSEADFPDAPQFYHFIDREYATLDIERHVRNRFRDRDYIVVTKGSVPDVFEEVVPDSIAFLHLDMNSPKAERGALEKLYDRLAPGGIIIFDDYGWKMFRKQKESAHEFAALRGDVILELPTGQGLMIRR